MKNEGKKNPPTFIGGQIDNAEITWRMLQKM